MTKWQLFAAMVNQQRVTYRGVTGTIQSIEMEDGSGSCFNVRFYADDATTPTAFVRTID